MGWLTLLAAIAARTSSRVRPDPASAAGSTWTRTAGFCAPLMVTRPTPNTWEIFCARMLSAASFTWSSGSVFEVTASVRMGTSAGLLFEYVGGAGSVRGSRLEAALMAACTSCSAASMFRSSSNCSVTCELPKLDTEVICASAGICPNCLSSGVVTAEAIVSALAPGSSVETRMVG